MINFVQRRDAFFSLMANNSVAIFPSSVELMRSNDTEFPFRQNSDFYYLTGFNEPDAYLLLSNKNAQQQAILFNRRKDKTAEVWQGYRVGQSAAVTELGFDLAFSVDTFDEKLETFIDAAESVYTPLFQSESLDKSLHLAVNQLRAGSRRGKVAPKQYIDALPLVHEMRLIKSTQEIELMRGASEISAAGHVRAMQKCQPNMWEYQLEAEIKHEFATQGAPEVAYNSIVAGGNNACILHYTENKQQLQNGDLVLIDAGAEYQGYAGDITRTFPVNGQFSEQQKSIYQLVLDVQMNAINQVKPGIAISDVNKCVVQQLTDGLLDLGLLQGDSATLINELAYKDFYMHGIGHYIGLDVHDVGDYGNEQAPRLLEAGMVLTIEPGLYISSDADVDVQWKGIGVRIEDDVLVTAQGAEVLTADVPKSINEIEALMADAKLHK